MRQWFAIGVTLATAAGASAQFAVDRKPTPAAPPAGPAPITLTPPSAPVAPATSSAPPSFNQVAATTARPAEPPAATHPWYVKPEHGQWMLVVKSYNGENAKVFAEQLAKEIRETYKTPAYLFERGHEEKVKEEDRVRIEREKKRAEQEQMFLKFNDQMREEAFKKGYEFQETRPKYRVPSIKYEEQYAVLVGGWKDMESARKGLDIVRRWAEPADKRLMDRGFIGGAAEKGQQTTLTGGFLNPFKLAFVAPNPAAPKTLTGEAGSDPYVLELNKQEPLSVLKIQKPWTIVVKAYYAPVDMKDKDANNVISIKRLFNSQPEYLDKTARLSQNLATLLRSLKPTPQFPNVKPFESYILHTLNGSLVCVGQFDSATDPRMLAEQDRLEALRLNVGEKGMKGNEVYPFDRLAAMQVK
ncbi:SPOR domain-containing protein [Limnoglobus roseus]|uniref:SPOR domain-containing protein n=1 Tax=Limnoglobus roseus TaxID=2598579 RepID=A0A5C1A767_9BACT|nr:hypothetical protein [Limnoglobus roseus]QEL13682.1 SPOR domain-containing protein [Limnoglobus roseus]